jgi:phosphoribosylaminoimidazole-succinocarboxamide synthase
MHTPDSSRFWLAASYVERFAREEPQAMLDKENLRQWLINERGFSGHGALPEIPDEVRVSLTEKYMEAYRQLTGEAFALKVGSVEARLGQNLKRAGLI